MVASSVVAREMKGEMDVEWHFHHIKSVVDHSIKEVFKTTKMFQTFAVHTVFFYIKLPSAIKESSRPHQA